MGPKTVKATAATFVRAAHPTTEYFTTAKTRVRVALGDSNAYFYFPSPVPLGSTVTDAYIELTMTQPFTATHTMTMQRIGKSKPFQQLNFSNLPDNAVGSTAVTATIPGGSSVWRFPVTADFGLFAAGTKNYGFRVRTDVATARNFYGPEAANTVAPRLVISWTEPSDAPTNLSPSDGVVSASKPVLTMLVPDGTSKVQVATAAPGAATDPLTGAFVAPTWTAEVVTSVGRIDLAATTYPGLATGGANDWMVRAFTPNGWTDWTVPHTWSRVVKGTLTISSPGTTSADGTPHYLWTYAQQTAWRAITTVDGAVVDDTGWRQGADSDYTPADGPRVNGQQATVTIYARDDKDRVETDGDPAYQSASVTYTLDFDGTVAPVQNLDAYQDRTTPCVWLSWTRPQVPDEVAIFRDGVMIARLDSADLLDPSGTVYTYADWTCPPNTQVTYRVAPIQNGAIADGGPMRTLTTLVMGIWVVDPESGRWFVLSGTSVELAQVEMSSVVVPLNAAASVVRRAGLRGLEGSIAGSLRDLVGRPMVEMDADLIAMRESRGLLARVIAGDFNILTPLVGLSSVIDGDNFNPMPGGRLMKNVAFAVYQQPEPVGTTL